MKRIIIVTNIPNHYRIPLFNKLNELLIKKGMELFVVFGADTYKQRRTIVDINDCSFHYRILDSSFQSKGGWLTYKGLMTELKDLKADKIIVAGFSIATLKVWIYSLKYNIPFIIWSGSINTTGSVISKIFRATVRRMFVKRASACLAYGTLAKKYFIYLGAKKDRVTIVNNTVDIDFFDKETEKARTSIGRIDVPHLTYVGYLSPRKNLKPLLKSLNLLKEKGHQFHLDVIGDGSSRKELENTVKENGMETFVSFHGFKQKEELPKYLALSSCFLFQSDFDIWGLVLNEAMAAGVPCLASIHAGATYDLIEDGINGFKVDFSDAELVGNTVEWILDNPKEVAKLSQNAKEKIKKEYSIEAAAEQMIIGISKNDI